MATIEKRLQALEREHQTLGREHTDLKKTIELQTIAIHALVSKEACERLQDTVEKSQEQNGKLFDVLNNHNIFTNERLGDIQNQIEELDGKIAGQQTEIRQRFSDQDGKIVGLQTEMRQRFNEQDSKIAVMATKDDIANMATNLRSEMAAMENRILSAVQQLATIVSTQRPQSE
jgi:chromosome segregation ATPase